MSKQGQTFMIPCNRAKELSERIEKEAPRDEIGLPNLDFRNLQRAMSSATSGFERGFFLICVAPEDYVLWPDGADIRDYQLVSRDTEFTIMRPEGTYSNMQKETQ